MTQVQQLTFSASPPVAERLGALGRTEDVVFSPDQTRLAIAGFTKNRVLVIRIEIVAEDGAMSVRSEGCVELVCKDFEGPHGLSWLDDETLVIGNRGSGVNIVSVPTVRNLGETIEIVPLLNLSKGHGGLIDAPGSVAVSRLSDQYSDLLVCNNYRNYVSRHILKRGIGYEAVADLRLFDQGLKVPDSITFSKDAAFVAVSNHYGNRIDVFANGSGSTSQSSPTFSLGVPQYPHGVRFALDDRVVMVADAGAPHVHVFARAGNEWKTTPAPDLSIRVMDDETFRRGQTNPQEGGPKGLDVLADGSLFVVSCEEVPIAFFDLRAVRDQLVDKGTDFSRSSCNGETRLIDTLLATVKGHEEQIRSLQAELAAFNRSGKRRPRTPDQWLVGLLKRALSKSVGPGGKG